MTNEIEAATDCWFLTGPTAAGKTTVALELADVLGAEIISLDSMAVYRGMNIGTAKPTAQQRSAVTHHLVDIRDPNQPFSVSEFVELAKEKIQEIHGRNREALFVGGTPLYLKAMLRGIFEGPPADWEFRRQIEEEVQRIGLPALYERLEQVDPVSAAKLHPHDKRRLIRALEVYTATGQPISHLQLQFEEGRSADQCRVFVLSWPRLVLHQRIEERVEKMFAEGLVDEVRQLLDRFGQFSRTASQALGYREVIEHLVGEIDEADAMKFVKTRTRQFARRQETWFRGLSECRFVTMDSKVAPRELAERIRCEGQR